MLLSVVVCVGIGLTTFPAIFEVREIPIEWEGRIPLGGRESLTFSRLNEILKEYVNRPLWESSVEEIQERLENDSDVRSVRIQRRWPNELAVSIDLKAPIFVYVNDRGEVFPIAQDGSFLRQVDANQVPDVPVVRSRALYESQALREKAARLISKIPETSRLSPFNVDEITVDEDRGVSLYLSDSDVLIHLGFELDSTKVQRVEQVLRYLETQGLQGRVIDATFFKKVLVRLRKGS